MERLAPCGYFLGKQREMRGPFYDIRGDEQYYRFGKSGF